MFSCGCGKRGASFRLPVTPRFGWHDGAVSENHQSLAALYCRHCGRSGWGAASKPASGHGIAPDVVWKPSLSEKRPQRPWIFAPGEGAAGDLSVQWADSETGELTGTSSGRQTIEVPVIGTPDEESATRQRCPSCGLDDGIRFPGSSVATLASAALGHVFASPDVEITQKKTLVFTDSVQDASHRAAFIESRAYALNRRSLVLSSVETDGSILDQIGHSVATTADTAWERYACSPRPEEP